MKKESLEGILFYYRQNGTLRGSGLPKLTDKGDIFMLKSLMNIIKEMRRNGIDSPDYTNTKNLGFKSDGSIGFFDMGFGNNREFDEFIERISISDENNLLNKIKSIMGVGKSKYLGSGMFGYAHDIGNNQILKITSDKSEAINSRRLIGRKNRYLCNIYDVRAFETTRKKEIYVIRMEKLRLSNKIDKLYNHLYGTIEDYKNEHLDESVLDGIKDPLVKGFLISLVKNGYSKTWGLYSERVYNYKRYDFNDIGEISEYIRGSVTESYYDHVPYHIKELLRKLKR